MDDFNEKEFLKLNFTHAEIAIISEILAKRLSCCFEILSDKNSPCVGCKKRWKCKKICKKLQTLLPKELETISATITLPINEIDPIRENK